MSVASADEASAVFINLVPEGLAVAPRDSVVDDRPEPRSPEPETTPLLPDLGPNMVEPESSAATMHMIWSTLVK
jgi:hypothetical protein